MVAMANQGEGQGLGKTTAAVNFAVYEITLI